MVALNTSGLVSTFRTVYSPEDEQSICSKRRDQTGSFQSHHSFKRGCTHGCIRKFTIHIYIGCYSYSPHHAKLQTPFNQCTSHETNGEKTRKEVLVLDVGENPRELVHWKRTQSWNWKHKARGELRRGGRIPRRQTSQQHHGLIVLQSTATLHHLLSYTEIK